MLKVDASELAKLASGLSAAGASTRSALTGGLSRYLHWLRSSSAITHPTWRNWTGNLSSAHKVETPSWSGKSVGGSVYVDLQQAPYGLYQYWGTPAHGPVRAPFMVWKSRDGAIIRAKWVRGVNDDKAAEWIWKEATGATGSRWFAETLEGSLEMVLGKI